MKKTVLIAAMATLLSLTHISTTYAARCGNTSKGFNSWLSGIKKQAAARGISKRTIKTALGNVRYSRKVIKLDRNQRSFHLSFSQFYKLRVNNALINKGRRKMRKLSGLLNRIEKRFGVQRGNYYGDLGS